MHRGYIKLWRKIRDNPRMHDPDYMALWIWLLIQANHKEQKEMLGGKTINCHPGQFTTGRKQLSNISGVERNKVERILNLMKSEQQIEQVTTNTNRLISIVNWEDYQGNEQYNEQQVSNKRATSEQRVSTLEECKECKEVKNKDTEIEIPEHLKEIWPTFLEVRKGKKAVNSPRALKMILTELNKLSTDHATQAKIIEQSIRSSWKDVYTLKNNGAPSPQQNQPIPLAYRPL